MAADTSVAWKLRLLSLEVLLCDGSHHSSDWLLLPSDVLDSAILPSEFIASSCNIVLLHACTGWSVALLFSAQTSLAVLFVVMLSLPWCWSALVLVCLGAGLPWCWSALVLVCLGAGLPWCWSALVLVCLGAGLPWCWSVFLVDIGFPGLLWQSHYHQHMSLEVTTDDHS